MNKRTNTDSLDWEKPLQPRLPPSPMLVQLRQMGTLKFSRGRDAPASHVQRSLSKGPTQPSPPPVPAQASAARAIEATLPWRACFEGCSPQWGALWHSSFMGISCCWIDCNCQICIWYTCSERPRGHLGLWKSIGINKQIYS